MTKAKLSFRCETELARAARAKATRDGVPLSTPVRLLLAQYVRGAQAPVETAQQLGGVLRQLIAIGRNLNQIARSLNAGYGARDYGHQTQELSHALRRLVQLIEPLALPPKGERA